MMQPPYGFNSGDSNERLYAILAHITPAAGFHIIGPLIIYLIFGKVSSFVEANARESLNFQISMLIYTIIGSLLMLVLIGFVLLPAIVIFALVEVIIASLKAGDGYVHEYPLCIRFIK